MLYSSTEVLEYADEADESVEAQDGDRSVGDGVEEQVVIGQHSQHVDDEETPQVLASDDVTLDIGDAAVVNEHDEEPDEDIHHHDAVAQIGQRPERQPERVERHKHERCDAVEHDRQRHQLLPDHVEHAAITYSKGYSPDDSPDEASPGGLARPLESIGRGSSKERLIIVVHLA